jgi:hypothetical protein
MIQEKIFHHIRRRNKIVEKTFAEAKYYRICWTCPDGEKVEGVWLKIVTSEEIINNAIKYLNKHTSSVYRVEYK